MVTLKVKNFNWLAGRPIVVLNDKTAEKLNVHVDERVLISTKSKKSYAVVDIFPKLVKDNEIGLSQEISRILKTKDNSKVEVTASELMTAGTLIKKKLEGKRLSRDEIIFLISDITQNNLTESEISYFVAAEKLRGMSMKEIIYLTEAMIKTGTKLKFKQKIVADKHSIGGVAGNRTTPIVISICASAGLILPKTSSRAITSAAGTADVIETIAKVELDNKEIKRVVNKTNACLVWGGSLGLAPSDDKIIQVERLLNLDVEPQLLASIISKKISAGSKYVLIDISYGKGAKVKSLKSAKKLGAKFLKLAKHFKIKLKPVYTRGSQPIGNGIGPVLEMLDVLAVLQNKESCPKDLKEKSIYLASELMKLCKIKKPQQKARQILESGEAYKKFIEIINAQNKDKNFEERVAQLKPAKFKKTIKAKKLGRIVSIDNKKINLLCRVLGAPESKGAGVYLHHHVGKIKKNEKIITLYSESKSKLKDGLKFIKEFKPIILK